MGLPLEKAGLLATIHGTCQVFGVLTILPMSDVLGRKKTIALSNALVAVRDHGDVQEIDVLPGAVYRFVFPPGQSHAVKNLSGGMNVLVAFNTVVHDRQHPDTTADVLLT